MSFPVTRHSLIQRLAVTGTEEGWRQFLEDYWPPVCRFAVRWGRLRFEDAEIHDESRFILRRKIRRGSSPLAFFIRLCVSNPRLS